MRKPKSFKVIDSSYCLPLLILISFALWFSYDIFTLKKFLNHPDISTYYYPFRQWFVARLLKGEFPLWNPYWGIGNPAVVWASIPLDIYTPLEIFFGANYHYFQGFQALLILFIGFYTFRKFNFKPITAAAISILYFMTPWVTYFYFYFLLLQAYLGNMLSFLFIYKWFLTKEKKYLLLISFATMFGMLGTKAEFWFFNCVLVIFYPIAAAFIFYKTKIFNSISQMIYPIMAAILGIIANLWQLNIMVNVMRFTDRNLPHGLSNLFDSQSIMYQNLKVSISESELPMIVLGCLIFYLGSIFKKRYGFVFYLAGLLALWKFPLIVSFKKSPIFIGVVLGTLLSLIFSVKGTFRDTKGVIKQLLALKDIIFNVGKSFKAIFEFKNINWSGGFLKEVLASGDQNLRSKEFTKTLLAFSPFIYYWCRPDSGDLGELETITAAPFIFKILISTLVWMGCSTSLKNKGSKSKLAKLALLTVLFVFIMRDQGQIILAFLAGIVWIPTRDNYIIDFAIAVLAAIGLSRLEILGAFKINRQLRRWSIVSLLVIFLVFWAYSPSKYIHPMMEDTPSDFPYFKGVPKVNATLRGLKASLPAVRRVYIATADCSKGATFGDGSCLLEEIGKVSQYDSTLPRNYKNWNVYKRFGVTPAQNWSTYTGALTGKTLRSLPKIEDLGHDGETRFFYSIRAIPPIKQNELKLLGVQYILKMFPTFGNERMIPESSVDSDIKALNLENVHEKNGLLIGRFNNPLPIAYLLSGVTENNIDEFSNELDPIVSDDNTFIKTKNNKFLLTPAKIEKYEPENVNLSVNTEKESYLVLSDLYHPFWHVKINGVETNIIPCFYIFRAVKIPVGKNQVEFYCKVPHFKTSVIVSLGVIVLLVCLFIGMSVCPSHLQP